MRFQARILFTVLIVILTFYAIFTARDWPLGTGLFPWFIGIPAFVLALVQLAIDLYHATRPEKEKNTETGDLQVDWSLDNRIVARRAMSYFGWLWGLFFGVWLFGFFISIPVFSFLYLKLQAKEGWLLSSALTLGAFVFLIGLFDQILHILWPQPLLPWPEALLKSLIPWIA